MRRRLRLPVAPVSADGADCTRCRKNKIDALGYQSIQCAGANAMKLRHNAIARIIVAAAKDACPDVDTEVGEHTDPSMFRISCTKRRPGDVCIRNFDRGKHLVIDVMVINALAETYSDDWRQPYFKAGDMATKLEDRKKYRDLVDSRYTFLPFVIESQGGMGASAKKLCKMLFERREKQSCRAESDSVGRRDKLLKHERDRNRLTTSVSVECQRHCSIMILDRDPARQNQLIHR